MKGGKFISAGSYGCVYGNKPLKCGNSRPDNKYVVKAMVSDREANKELAEGKLIKKIDPKSEFTIYPIKKCKISTIDSKEDNCLNDCQITGIRKKAIFSKKSFTLLLLKIIKRY